MAKLVMGAVRARGETVPTTLVSPSQIPDYSSIGGSYQASVLECYTMGILVGTDANGSFSPNGVMDRASSTMVIYRLLETSKRNAPEIKSNSTTNSRSNYDETRAVQTFNEGEAHEPCKPGDTVIKADGTKVVLKETTMKDNRVVLGYNQGVDYITGTRGSNGHLYQVGDNAWYAGDATKFLKSDRTGEVFTNQQWNSITTMKPTTPGTYDGEIRDTYFEWDSGDWYFIDDLHS